MKTKNNRMYFIIGDNVEDLKEKVAAVGGSTARLDRLPESASIESVMKVRNIVIPERKRDKKEKLSRFQVSYRDQHEILEMMSEIESNRYCKTVLFRVLEELEHTEHSKICLELIAKLKDKLEPEKNDSKMFRKDNVHALLEEIKHEMDIRTDKKLAAFEERLKETYEKMKPKVNEKSITIEDTSEGIRSYFEKEKKSMTVAEKKAVDKMVDDWEKRDKEHPAAFSTLIQTVISHDPMTDKNNIYQYISTVEETRDGPNITTDLNIITMGMDGKIESDMAYDIFSETKEAIKAADDLRREQIADRTEENPDYDPNNPNPNNTDKHEPEKEKEKEEEKMFPDVADVATGIAAGVAIGAMMEPEEEMER